MPIIKSAKKRVRIAAKAAIRNSKTKRLLKAALKLFTKAPATDVASSAQSAIDTAAKKGIMHKNKAARLKKQLAAQAKAAGVKPEASKKPTPKAAAPAVKAAAPAKKVATKTPAAAKPAVKKPAAKKAAK